MIETFCKICGDRYPLGQDHECKKRPAKKSSGGSSAVERRVANAKAAGSSPARRSKEPRSTAGTQRQNTTAAALEAVAGGPAAVNGATTLSTARAGIAGTQAPPVDTILARAEADAAHLAPKHSGGRPKKHEDRKAYRAQKAREYRERDRAAKAQQEGK